MLERHLKKFAKMRTKKFFLLSGILLATIVLIWLFSSSNSHLQQLVSHTEQQFKDINSKFDVLNGKEDKKDPKSESTYLELLGLLGEPKVFKEPDKKETNQVKDSLFSSWRIPPLVTAFGSFSEKERLLIESKLKFFYSDPMFIYDLDLSSSEQLMIKKLCNKSCLIKPFKGENYPDHVIDAQIKAFKPIIIQEILNEYGAIIWIEAPNVFVSNKSDNFLAKSRKNGLLAWPEAQPVSQMTHPTMFSYLNTKQQDFYFVHMLDTSQMIIFNNRMVHQSLMLPWVKCALKAVCIAPPGSKFSGCNFSRRPYFKYSGCHRYEQSAFTIIAALLYKFDESQYTTAVEKDPKLANSSFMYLLNKNEHNSALVQTFYQNSFMSQPKFTTSTSSHLNESV